MAKHDRDPVLRELIRSVNESGQSAVPVTVAINGTVLHGSLIAEERYFTELAEVNPLMNALNPRAGLLGNDYEKNVKSESGHYLHLRAARLATGDGPEGLWRIQADEIDAWTFRAYDGPGRPGRQGPLRPAPRLLVNRLVRRSGLRALVRTRLPWPVLQGWSRHPVVPGPGGPIHGHRPWPPRSGHPAGPW